MLREAKKGGVYTAEQVAELLQVNIRAVYYLCKKNPPFKVIYIGRSIRVPKDSFDAWLNAE